jgi:hypothetical protein
VLETLSGPQTQQDVHIGKTGVRIQDAHTPAVARQGDSEIDGNTGLADDALAAGDGNDPQQPVPSGFSLKSIRGICGDRSLGVIWLHDPCLFLHEPAQFIVYLSNRVTASTTIT